MGIWEIPFFPAWDWGSQAQEIVLFFIHIDCTRLIRLRKRGSVTEVHAKTTSITPFISPPHPPPPPLSMAYFSA